jgi:c-di-GMP-binding flagellar brake protein YcgR
MSGDGTIRGQLRARLLDISPAGALLLLDAPLAVGGIHDFALDLAGHTLWVQGEVRHCRPATRGAGHEVGVAFVGIDPQDERRLLRFLARA